ncbi:unnamed protein product, partial [Prorocentrum cordatum]
MQKLTEAFEIHDQDKQGEYLDKFLDTRRGNQTLQEFLLSFRERYTEANDKADLTISNVGLTHMLFKWCGLPVRRIADIKLHINGYLEQFQTVYSMLTRIAKQEMASGSGHAHHYMDDDQVSDHVVDYYQDYDDEGVELIDWTHDEESGLHYREYWTETGEATYGAYDDNGIWYEANDIEAWLDEQELDQAYQMNGFRRRFRFGGFRRKGKGKSGKGKGGRGRSKSRGRGFGHGKGRWYKSNHYEEPTDQSMWGDRKGGKKYGKHNTQDSNKGQKLEVKSSSAKLSGIDGVPNPSLGLGKLPLNLDALPNSSFTMDMLGGSGSRCPLLMPLETMINNTMGLLTGILPNRDGVLIINTLDGLGNKVRPTCYMRALYTDSGHYLFPIDDPQAGTGRERDRLKQAVKAYMAKVLDEDTPKSTTTVLDTVLMTNTDRDDKQIEAHQSLDAGIYVPDSHRGMHSGKKETLALSNALDAGSYVPDLQQGGVPSGKKETIALSRTEATELDATKNEEAQTSESRMRVRSEVYNAISTNTDTIYSDSKDYYRRWRTFKASRWTGVNMWPKKMDTNKAKQLDIGYRAMPEEFYFESQLPVVTPENLESWMEHMSIYHVDVQERMSGSSRFSRRASLQGLMVGFPVDYRYGWDMSDKHHQRLLSTFRGKCHIGTTLWAPTCQPWSIASRHKDPAALESERRSQAPAIIFMLNDIKQTADTEQQHIVENPHNSDFWSKSDYTGVVDMNIMRSYAADQCSFGATNELGEPIRKRTRLDSTFSLRASTRHCRCKIPHGHLTGAVDGIKRTAKAAVYPKNFCDAIVQDIIRIVRHQIHWGCERCRLGNKTDADHTRKPGNCRRRITSKQRVEEPEIAMKKWYDVKPNFDLSKMVSRLKEATDKKEILQLLLGFHIRFWRAPVPDMVIFLKSAECWNKTLAAVITMVCLACSVCRDLARPLAKPRAGITVPLRFNHRVQLDLFFMWDKVWLLVIDELSRYKVADIVADRTPKELLTTLMRSWIRYFGPMQIMVLDQEGGLVSELSSRTCDKLNIKRRYAGTDDHTMTGLVERWIQLVRLCAMKLKRTCTTQGFEVSDTDLVQEAAMVSNSMVSYGGQTATQVVLGFTPNDYYDLEATTLDSVQSADVSCPDPFEAAVRLRLLAKAEMARAIVEDRVARANRTRVQQHGPEQELKVGESVDIYRVPDRKDQPGWRGQAELVKISEGTAIVVWNGVPYILPVRYLRRHLVGFLTYQATNISELKTDDQQMLNTLGRLMDIVDGSIYGQVTRLGRTITQDGQVKCSPDAKTLVNLQPWKLSMMTYRTIFHLKSLDGILYGTSLRRVPPLHAVRFGLLVLWERKDRTNYMTYEIDPSMGVTVGSLVSFKWENTSFMMYYSIPSQSDPFLDEHHLPDMNDLSRIEPVPESAIDVNRDVHDMISLLPDLDDWMDQ